MYTRGRKTTAIGRPPLGDGETLRWWAILSELAPVGSPLPWRTLNQTPIHGLNGSHELAFFLEKSAENWPLQGNQAGRTAMPTTELQMDYFDCTGPISLPKEITNKESPGPGNRNNRELVSPIRETTIKKHGIITKIKTKKWHGCEEIMRVAKNI